MLRRSPLLPFTLGLGAVYVAERTLAGNARWVFVALGGALLALGFGLALGRLARWWRPAGGESRRAAGAAVVAYAVAIVAVLLYAVQTAFLGGAEHATARTFLLVAWPFLLLFGLAPALAIELALASMARSPTLELWRIRLAARAALIVVSAVVVFAGANYAASQWNRKIDLSYFRTTEPSEPTLQIVRDLAEPVRLLLFAPPGNEVAEHARSYLADLARASPQIRLEVVDQALVPELAREMKVRQNGMLAMARGSRSETLHIGLDMESARHVLRKLDGEVQQRLLKLARPPRTIYVTTGHLERDWTQSSSDKRLGLSDFKLRAESLGFTVKRLGLGEGLGAEIPKDAGIVVVAGPLEPFLPAERAALRAFLERGGRLLALLDPDRGVTEDDLLAPLGVRVSKNLVANERATVRIEGRGESLYDFATPSVSSHPSAATLGQNPGRMAIVFLGVGAVEKRDDAPAGLRQTFTVRSLPGSWEDTNRNRAFDRALEKQGVLELAVAIERPATKVDAKADAKADTKTDTTATTASTPQPMRALVIGDADVAGDGLLRNPGNHYLLLDGLKWLGGDEALAGKTTSEEDVPLVHKREEDAVWFYGTSFVVPAAILAGGLFVSRGGRRRRRS